MPAFVGVPLIVPAILAIIRQDFSKAETSFHCFEAALSLLQSCQNIVLPHKTKTKKVATSASKKRQGLEEQDSTS